MLADPAKIVPDDLERFDVCVIGSGPAGITLAREISQAGFRVCLLESGGKKSGPQTLNTGSVDSEHGYGEQILREGRRRQFGGTANLWNHQVRGESGRHIRYLPLDEIDFERRDWVPESGWPFSRHDLQPFYELAGQFCGIGHFASPSEGPGAGALSGQPWQTEKIESVASLFGSSEIFLDRYRRELPRDERVNVILNATLLEVKMDSISRTITAAVASTPKRRRFMVRAQIFVLAAGGMENARVLLLQEALQSGGLGNQHDMVGRCFMDHPAITLGTLIPSSGEIFARARFYDQHDEQGQDKMHILHIRSEVMRREKMLNLCAVLVPHLKDFWSNRWPIFHQVMLRAPRFIYRHLVPAPPSGLQNGGEPSRPFRQRLLEQYYSLGQCGWSRRGNLEQRFAEFGVHGLVEQAPDLSNRITLGDEKDLFGQPKAKVYWRWNELDLASIRTAQTIFREQLSGARIGAFLPVEETTMGAYPRRFSSPHHFMGTTRIHDNPRKGVVDADCRVHEVSNLFIAGSSVFPTGGFANPTLTIVALALRLAAYLKAELRASPHIQSAVRERPNQAASSKLSDASLNLIDS
jgi:choline dehydrogenase-like flavoprotein